MTTGNKAATTVACCQIPLAVGDVRGNRAAALHAVETAAAAGARVVVLPELSNSGYVFRDAAQAAELAEPLDGPTVTGWSAAAERYGLVLVAGLCERDRAGEVRNSAVLIDRSGVRAVYRKAHLWGSEPAVFTRGDDLPPIVDTPLGRIAMMVCYDLEFPEWVRTAALRGADLLCAPANWPLYPRPAGERPAEVVRVQAGASVNRIFIAACDRTGSENGVEWTGGSVIADPDGFPLAGPLPDFGEGMLLAECRLGQARDKRLGEHNDVFADRRSELYAEILPSAGPTPRDQPNDARTQHG